MAEVDLDERIAVGLRAATAPPVPVDRAQVAAILAGRAVPRRRRPLRVVAAVAAAVLLVAGLAWFGRDRAADRVVTTDELPSAGWSTWEPGWHDIDPGPLPATGDVSLARLGDELVVVTSETATAEGAVVPAGAWAFDPAGRRWRELPAPPFAVLDVVATDDGLVAVGREQAWAEAPSWATWRSGEAAWTVRGAVPAAPAIAAVGSGVRGDGGEQIVWTGERVLDLTQGAVLDPATGEVDELALPADVVGFTHLVGATAVWTGTRAVLVGWSRQPGLSWDAFGQDLATLPAPPAAPAAGGEASTVAVEGQLVAVAREGAGGTVAVLDPVAPAWTEGGTIPTATEVWCPYRAAAVGARLVVQGCEERGDDAAVAIAPDVATSTDWAALDEPPAWDRLERPPRPETGIETWLGTDDALVVWSGDADVTNNPDAPYRWLAVWIPPTD
ncbi:MAG: hypothetical protein KDA97_05700 [Acidimicrobiales bacterium]|nr:hypothetical protein [Acidimicrobiales bacterium]